MSFNQKYMDESTRNMPFENWFLVQGGANLYAITWKSIKAVHGIYKMLEHASVKFELPQNYFSFNKL